MAEDRDHGDDCTSEESAAFGVLPEAATLTDTSSTDTRESTTEDENVDVVAGSADGRADFEDGDRRKENVFCESGLR